MILMPVSQYDSQDIPSLAKNCVQIGYDDVDTRHRLIGKHEPRIDNNCVVLVDDSHHIEAYFSESPQRKNFKCSVFHIVSPRHAKYLATMSPISDVEWPMRPASRLFKLLLITLTTAFSMDVAADGCPRISSINPPARIHARGLITFLPVYFGAEPPIGSNIDT